LPTGTRLELESRIKARLNDVCWKWGVEIIRVTIEQVVPPKELSDAAYRTYLVWNQMNEQVLEAERQAQMKLRLAQIEHEEMRLHKETDLLHAETDKQKEILQAEGDAVSYEKRMKARADGALEFARRIETLRQAMGSTLDEGTFRELLRALELLREDDRDEVLERESLARLMGRFRPGRQPE
jgi:regulator of protease activity HflC (stomatin/prohibitin superfamily)